MCSESGFFYITSKGFVYMWWKYYLNISILVCFFRFFERSVDIYLNNFFILLIYLIQKFINWFLFLSLRMGGLQSFLKSLLTTFKLPILSYHSHWVTSSGAFLATRSRYLSSVIIIRLQSGVNRSRTA